MELNNPFFCEWNTPHATVPFDQILPEHFEPALREGTRLHKQEIESITESDETPTFHNTIVPLERSGRSIEKVYGVLQNLLSAENNDTLQDIAEKMTPEITAHFNDISLNDKLFERIRSVYDRRDSLHLNLEESKLLENNYESFVRHGANLNPEEKQRYRSLTEELSLASLRYGQNVLKETTNWELHLTDPAPLTGIPESVLEAAAYTARQAGKEGWIFTLHAPSFLPFMQYCQDRKLREKMFTVYNTRCTHDNEYCNFPLVARMVNLRRELAQLLGYKDYAEYVLTQRMAENQTRVFGLLNQLLEAYRPAAFREMDAIRKLAEETDQLAVDEFRGWDFAYYSEKLKERDYQLNDEQIRPYLQLDHVIEGVFGLAGRLYGISFRKNPAIPVYHPDVETFEVFDRDGSFLAVLYTDFFPREGKRPGAWMTTYKGQWREEDGTNSRPHVSLVMNFTKPTEEKPALLTLNELETFLHEFGHALHGMFADSTYESLSGTNVYWDFVELPSQFMENYATQKAFLHTFARHFQTGELIPDELVDRIVRANNFNVAYFCLRQLSFGLLDMAWYSLTTPFAADLEPGEAQNQRIIAFERAATESTRILPPLPDGCMSVQFSHIFAGGYSAGYYSYKWAEVLDADAFSLFVENGIFDAATADSFRRNILSRGGSEHPMILYKRFRGQEPTIDALLIRNGIKK